MTEIPIIHMDDRPIKSIWYSGENAGGYSTDPGHHFTAMCFDSLGRRIRNGGDFQRAEDEGAFPVWWVWPDQIPELVGRIAELRADLFTAGQVCDLYATGGAA